MKLEIVFPSTTWTSIEQCLEGLTEAISKIKPDEVAHGLLGGEFGYGAHWENKVFLMHPYCWCEKDTCPWCARCSCPESAWHYFTDGKEVKYAEYQAFFERLAGKNSHKNHDAWMKRADSANRRRTVRKDDVCDNCNGKGPASKFGGEKHSGAPNFWHKPSGFKVWWYKYIGRDQKTSGDCDIQKVFNECLKSLEPPRIRGKGGNR